MRDEAVPTIRHHHELADFTVPKTNSIKKTHATKREDWSWKCCLYFLSTHSVPTCYLVLFSFPWSAPAKLLTISATSSSSCAWRCFRSGVFTGILGRPDHADLDTLEKTWATARCTRPRYSVNRSGASARVNGGDTYPYISQSIPKSIILRNSRMSLESKTTLSFTCLILHFLNCKIRCFVAQPCSFIQLLLIHLTTAFAFSADLVEVILHGEHVTGFKSAQYGLLSRFPTRSMKCANPDCLL